MVGNKVVHFPSLFPIRDISWCCKPLFCWLRILGIELEPIRNEYRKVSYIYGLAVLLIFQWASFDITFLDSSVLSANKDSNTSSATYSWNVRIDHANHFCLMAIVSPAFFCVAQGRWLRLWKLMNVLDCTYRINHGQLRKFILIGFFPIGMVWIIKMISVFLFKQLKTYSGNRCNSLQLTSHVARLSHAIAIPKIRGRCCHVGKSSTNQCNGSVLLYGLADLFALRRDSTRCSEEL